MQMVLSTFINSAEMPEGLIYDKDKIVDHINAHSGKAVLFLGAIPTELDNLKYDDDAAVICLNDFHMNSWKATYTTEDHKSQMKADWTADFIQADFNNGGHLSRLAEDIPNTFDLVTLDIEVRKFANIDGWLEFSLVHFLNMLKPEGKLVFDNGGYGSVQLLSPSEHETINELMPKTDHVLFFAKLRKLPRIFFSYIDFHLAVKDYSEEQERDLSEKYKNRRGVGEKQPDMSSLIAKMRALNVEIYCNYEKHVHSFFELTAFNSCIDYSIEYGVFPYWKNIPIEVNYLILTKKRPETINIRDLVKIIRAKEYNNS